MKTIEFDVVDSTRYFLGLPKGMHTEALKRTANVAPVATFSSHGSGGSSAVYSSASVSTSNHKSITQQMQNRRDRDKNGQNEKSGGSNSNDYDRTSRNRIRSMAAYAVDISNMQRYIGYSGGASIIAANQMRRGEMYNERLDRIEPYVRGTRHVEEHNEINCAEVAALSIAISWGAEVRNLAFCAMDTDGNWRDPCGNCMQWIQLHALAYMNWEEVWIACQRQPPTQWG